MTEPLISSPSDLAAELAAVLRRGVSVEGLRGCPSTLSLALTHAKAASDQPNDLAVAAHSLVAEAAARVDDGGSGAASYLLGLAPGSRGALLKDRRRWAAEALSVSPEHLRKDREPLLLEAVADELYALDSAYRLRHQHRLEPERTPERSALGIDWLAQHRSYRRIWTPITGMRNDLYVLLRYLAEARRSGTEDREAIADRLATITWHWARFQAELQRFVAEQGGLWLLADADSEIAAADAIYRIGWHVPLGEADNSWLRTLLAETPHQEMDGFADRLIAAGERRRELMAAWMDWARGCRGDLRRDDPGCELHRWHQAAEDFVRLIDADWYRVADFYRELRGDPSGDDVRELWES